MSAVDRLAAAMSSLDAASREQQEQRGLRERHVAEGKAAAMESMQKDAAVHGRYMAHMQELAKRHKEAGGWLTEKALADRSHTMAFGPEDEEKPADDFGQYARPEMRREVAPPPPPPPIAPSVPGMPGQPEPAGPAGYGGPPPGPVGPAGPSGPSGPEQPVDPAPPAGRRRGRHARNDSFDDDDFSNNSWMVD